MFMINKIARAFVVLTVAALMFGGAVPFLRAQERFFDTASPEHTGVRLVVFNPILPRVKDLIALRAEKLIDIENLTVIGVYHRDQTVNFVPARDFVREEHLDWFRFHEVEARVEPGDVYRPNALTAEVEKIFRLSDGMIFTGGPDIPPAFYRSKTSLLTIIEDPARHDLELAALFQLLGGSQDKTLKPLLDSRPEYPILAICLGAQSLNVATGGTLVQDIWDEVYGKKYVEDILRLGLERWHNNPYARLYPDQGLAGNTLQPVAAAGKGRLWQQLGLARNARPYILSSHHQAMAKLGRDLQVEATSIDGKVVEALSHKRFPNVLAVQFHPEARNLWDASLPYRVTPGESSPPTWKGFLESRPPSLDFHRRLWAWFADRLQGKR